MLNNSNTKSQQPNIRHGLAGITLYFGPMFSGKTLSLTTDLTLYADLGFKVLLITYQGSEERTTEAVSGAVTSHNSQFNRMSPKIDVVSAKRLDQVEMGRYDVIGIDEAQFFGDLKPTTLLWLLVGQRRIICAGLDADFNREPFNIDPQTPNGILSLIPHADHVEKLHAKCVPCLRETQCLVNASYTARLVAGSGQVLIGGAGEYEPMCFYHHELHRTHKRCPTGSSSD